MDEGRGYRGKLSVPKRETPDLLGEALFCPIGDPNLQGGALFAEKGDPGLQGEALFADVGQATRPVIQKMSLCGGRLPVWICICGEYLTGYDASVIELMPHI